MVATVDHSLLPMPLAAHPRTRSPYSSPVGYARAAARRLSNALPYQWNHTLGKDPTSSGFSDVDLDSHKSATLPCWVGQSKVQEAMPSQLCPGGFPHFEGDVRFDPLETAPSLLPSHSCRPRSSSSSLSDLDEVTSSCSTADVLSLLPGSLLLDLHTCRDASKVACTLTQSEATLRPVTEIEKLAFTEGGRPRRKSAPRRFLETELERSPRQLPLFSWNTTSFGAAPATPELQAPGWKQVDYFGAPCAPTPLEGQYTASSTPSTDEGMDSDEEGNCFTAAQMVRMFEPFDRRPSNVAALESLRPAGILISLEGRARAMSAPVASKVPAVSD